MKNMEMDMLFQKDFKFNLSFHPSTLNLMGFGGCRTINSVQYLGKTARVVFHCLILILSLFPNLIYCETYKGNIDDIKVSFEYPSDWQLGSSQGKTEKYNEIFLKGPRNKANTYNVLVSVTTYPLEKYESLQAMADDYIKKYSKFKGYKLINSDKTGTSIELELAYIFRLPLYSPKAQDTKIKEKVVFLKQNDHFFKLKYNASEEDYNTYLSAFSTFRETFR